MRNRLGIGGIELGGLVEVVGDESLGDLVVFPPVGPDVEYGLGGPLAGWMRGGEVGSPMWARICVMGSGSVRKAMKVRGVWQVGQISGNTS